MGYETDIREITSKSVFTANAKYSIDDLKGKKVGSNYFFSTANSKVIKTTTPNGYIEEYTGFSDFKRRIFKCEKIEYSPDTGRVKSLSFKEIDPN